MCVIMTRDDGGEDEKNHIQKGKRRTKLRLKRSWVIWLVTAQKTTNGRLHNPGQYRFASSVPHVISRHIYTADQKGRQPHEWIALAG